MMQRRRETARAQAPAITETALPATAAPAGAQAAATRPVRVIAGADVLDMELAGRTVADARAVVQAVFGVDPHARALVDGREVGPAHVLAPGEQLELTRHAGEKGAAAPGAARAGDGPVIEIARDRVVWRRGARPLGATTVAVLLERAAAAGVEPDRWRLHPRHVRLMAERAGGCVTGVVIEMPPGPREVGWIADDSPAPYGPAARYEPRRLSFPWTVLIAVFAGGELSGQQQAFYRTAPLTSLDDELYFTNLLNVARGYGQESWVCLANLVQPLGALTWDERIATVIAHVWQAQYNRSSEVHEANSYYGTTRDLDPRLASAAAWEAATRAEPYFALEVKWRRAPHTLGETLARMLDAVAPRRPIERVEQLVTLMQRAEVPA
jgi:hypothetical protein